tara:strand:+ start:517 stop:804 length:288 start_codon:yes stop_codon:yes gene_type:complete
MSGVDGNILLGDTMNIGDIVKFYDIYNDVVAGVVEDVSSDMDSYDNMKLEDGIPYYYSKKLSRYVPVKPKNMASVFLEVSHKGSSNDFVGIDSVI